MPTSHKISFPGANGVKLAARLDKACGPARGYALFAHCFTCSKDVLAASRIAASLADEGITVLRFDFTGLGHSEGEFANTNFSSNVEDLEAAAKWMADEGMAPTLLIGHSLGGAAAVVAADRIAGVKAVVTIGAPARTSHVVHQFGDKLAEIEASGEAEVVLAGRPFKVKRQFVEDVKNDRVLDAAARIKRPLLILHSPLDETVSIDNATDLFVAAKHPKSFVSLDNADHLLTSKPDASYAAQVIAAWAARYAMDAFPETAPKPGEGKRAVVVEETGRSAYENWVVAGPHRALADEPVSVGGGDAGPDPYQYLNAALGACTSMTMRMYANRKGWPVEKISVNVTHEKTHADDCETCESRDEKVDVFERKIRIEGDLDEKQRARMLEIADKCPVHRTLHSPTVIRTTEST